VEHVAGLMAFVPYVHVLELTYIVIHLLDALHFAVVQMVGSVCVMERQNVSYVEIVSVTLSIEFV
jgi:hypothetical protein